MLVSPLGFDFSTLAMPVPSSSSPGEAHSPNHGLCLRSAIERYANVIGLSWKESIGLND